MKPPNSMWAGRLAIQINGKYVSLDPASGTLTATADTITATEQFNVYQIQDTKGTLYYQAGLPSNHNFFSNGNCWPSGCNVMAIAPTLDAAIGFIPTNQGGDPALYWQSTGGGMVGVIPGSAGLVISSDAPAVPIQGSFVVYGYPALYGPLAGTWAGADLRFADLTDIGQFPPNLLDWTGTLTQGFAIDHQDLTHAIIPPTINFDHARMSNVIFPPGVDLRNVPVAGIDWTNVDLRQVLLRNDVDLSNAKLTGANLDGLDLSHANLLNADLSGVSARNTNFSHAILRNTSFANATLLNNDFSAADLYAVNFTACDLTTCTMPASPNFSRTSPPTAIFAKAKFYAGMIGSNWSYFDLGGATILDLPPLIQDLQAHDAVLNNLHLDGINFAGQAVFSRSPLNGTTFRSSTISNALIDGTSWIGADLSNAMAQNLSFANLALDRINMTNTVVSDYTSFVGSTLPGAIMNGLHAAGANFNGCNMAGVPLNGATVPSAVFDNVNLVNGAMNDVSANGATFRAAKLDFLRAEASAGHLADFTNAVFDGATLRSAAMAHITAPGAHFVGCDLGQANLEGAVLSGAAFTDAVLSAASLANAILTGADFRGAVLGAKKQMFVVAASFGPELDNLVLSAALRSQFVAHGITLSAAATVTVRALHANWVIDDTNAAGKFEVVAAADGLRVLQYQASRAAVLTNAYMPNASFREAILFGADLTNVQWYGTSANANGADLEEVRFAGANISATSVGGVTLREARLFGATFSNAILINADFTDAFLSPSANGVAATFAAASLEGALFTGARLNGADFTNAAVALDAGVPLFTLAPAARYDLDGGTLTPEIISWFARHGYSLLPGSTLAVIKPGVQWEIANGGSTPPSGGLGAAYQTFAILSGPDALPVFGSAIWVTQVDTDGHATTIGLLCTPTAITADLLPPDAVCPSGDPRRDWPANGLTWQQMMTAHQPPPPPICVPSPTKWC